MEAHAKRLHPFQLLLDLVGLIKGNFFFAILLFVLHKDTTSMWWLTLRWIFVAAIIFSIFYKILQWLFFRYSLKEGNIHIEKGVFVKSKQSLSLERIQNIQRHTSFIHKILGITSLSLETGESGENSSISLTAVSIDEADRLEERIHQMHQAKGMEESVEEELEENPIISVPEAERVTHFQSTHKDILKASFTSLSFFALIPIIFAIYSNLDDFFDVDNIASGWFQSIMRYWWLIAILIIVFIVIAVGFGIVSTYLKYGRYEIVSDSYKIYIKKGILSESSFSISKEKVQAIEIVQSPIKRILRLAEVKLISAGETGEEELESNSLFPFLPVDRAYEIIEELLPSYRINTNMNRLPRKTFLVRLLRPSYFWLLSTGVVLYFFSTYWYISLVLLVLIITARIWNTINSRYLLDEEFIQLKSGSYETSLVVTKRAKVIEIEVKRSKWQKVFGVATMKIVNRAKPIAVTESKDIPEDMAKIFYQWYRNRMQDVSVD